jgi:O-antigen/teichoic acid export membrane protein
VSAPESPPGLAGVVVRGAGLAAAGFALTQILSLAFYLVLARLAAPEDFGLFAAGSIVAGIGMLFAESGMLAALIQRRDRIEEAASTAVVATLLGGLGLSVLALALAPLIGWYFQSGDVTAVAAGMSGWLFLQSATIVPDALLQRRFSFARRVVIEPVATLAFGIVAVWTCANGLGVWGLVLGTYALGVTQVVLAWSLARWRPRLGLASFAMWRELIGYGRHVLVSELVRRISAEFDTALVGRFVGTAALGQYRYARRFATQPLLAVVNVGSYVLLPALARIAGDEERIRAAFLRSLRWTAVIAFPLSLAFVPLGEPIAVVLLGEEWRSAGRALAAMFAYSAGGAVVSVASEAFKATGRPDVLPAVHLTAAVLSAVLMLALLPFGMVGIAAAVSLSSVGVAAYALRRVSGVLELPLRRMLRELGPPLLAAVAAAGAVLALEELVLDVSGRGGALGLALLAVEGAAGAAVYVGALAAIAPATAAELAGGVRGAWSRLRRRRPPQSTSRSTMAP